MRPGPVADVEAYLLTRLRGILAIGFQAPIGDAAFAARVAEFVGAIGDMPIWAIAEACDKWVRTQTRAPAPADLVAGCEAAMARIADELRHRAELDAKRVAEEAEARREAERAAVRVTPDAAARIMAEYGFSAEVSADIASGTVSNPADDPQPGTPQHAALAAARLSAKAFLDAVSPVGGRAE